MKISYDLKHEDFEAASRFMRASKPLKGLNRSALVSGGIIAVVSVALLLSTQSLRGRLPPELRSGPWGGVFNLVPLVIIFPMVLCWVMYWRRGFSKGVRERTGEALSEATSAEITEE